MLHTVDYLGNTPQQSGYHLKIDLCKSCEENVFFICALGIYGNRIETILKHKGSFWSRAEMFTLALPLDETHLVAVRGLHTKKIQPKCANKESSSKRRCFVRQGLTDLPYATAKDLIQSRRIYNRVASLSLVSFCHSSVMSWSRLTFYISISLFRRAIISYRSLSSC